MTLALMTAVPLATALLLVVVGSRIGRGASAAVGAAGLILAFGAAGALAQAFAAGKSTLAAEIGPWIPIRGAGLALVVDQRTVALLLATTALGALIGLYAALALPRDAKASRFFVALNVLVGSLLIVLAARDLILLFAGWLLVGTSMYLLLARDRDRGEAATAAARAFVVARVADAALLVAVFALLAQFQTVDLEQIAALIATSTLAPAAVNALRLASVLFILAALTRAAQAAVQVSLPERSRASAVVTAATNALAALSAAFLLIRLAAVLDPLALPFATIAGIAVALIAAVGVLELAGDRFRALAPAVRAAALIRTVDGRIERLIPPPFRAAATLAEQGGELTIATAAAALVRGTARVSDAVDRFQRSSVWAHEALLLAAAAVIVAYWIVR